MLFYLPIHLNIYSANRIFTQIPCGSTPYLLYTKSLETRVYINSKIPLITCIYGVEAALAAGAKGLLVYGDSLLIISQANEEWEVKEERLKPYYVYL